MPTINDLGRKVKAKYPGQYDDLSDIEVGRRTKAKYPTDYADFSDADSARIAVRGHERNRPQRKPAAQSGASPITEATSSRGGGASWEDPAQTAFGQPISAMRNMIDIATTVGGTLGSLAVPEVGVPALATKLPLLARAAQGLVPVLARAGWSMGGASATRGLAQGVSGAAPDPAGDAKAVREQGLASLAGDTGVGVFKFVGRGAMGAATRFTPEAAQTAISEGIAATRGGVKKLENLLGDLGDRTRAMVRMNRQTFQPIDILNGSGQALVDEVQQNMTGLAPEIWEQYRKEAMDLVRRHTHPTTGVTQDLTSLDLHKLKQDAQKIADPVYKRIGSLNPPSPLEKTQAKFYKAIADYAQGMLERTTPPAINHSTGTLVTLAEINARTGRAKVLLEELAPEATGAQSLGAKVIEAATRPMGRTVGGMTVGAGIGAGVPGGNNAQQALNGALVGGALANPQTMSLLALLLHNPALLGTVRQTPRLVMQAAHE